MSQTLGVDYDEEDFGALETTLDNVVEVLRKWHDDTHAGVAFRFCATMPCCDVRREMTP